MKTLMVMILSVLSISCANQKHCKNPRQEILEIKFGSSGGFTGLGNQYLLKPDRNIYKNSSDTLILLNQIAKKDLKNIKKQLIELDFENLKLLEKGNMTWFIEVKTSAYQNKITWSDQTQNDSVKQFYKVLTETLKK